MQDELAAGLDDGMAGVIAALVADDPVDILRKDVDDFVLPFIAPLGADNDGVQSRISFASKTFLDCRICFMTASEISLSILNMALA